MHSGRVRLPVFVHPHNITFFLDDQSTHKQVLTLYNPYEFGVRFRVLGTAPNKYIVVEAEGSIGPHCRIDIVIRHNGVSLANCGVSDKFRIQMTQLNSKDVIGKQDVVATLLPGKQSEPITDPEEFQKLARVPGPSQQQVMLRDQRLVSGRVQNPNYIAVAAGLVCIGVLMLPTQGDKDSRIPEYLHVSSSLKLMLAYFLGMVTMVLLKPM